VDFWKTVLVLFRRWYIALPVFVLALGATGAVYETTPAFYTSNGEVVLTTPPAGGLIAQDPSQRSKLNPLLGFDDGLTITCTILIQNLNSPSVMAGLTTSGHGDGLTIGAPLNLNGPFIQFQGTSTNKANAEGMVSRAITAASQELYNRQTELHAPTESFITLSQVVSPTPPEAKNSSKARSAGAVLGIGLILTLTATYGVESFFVARRKKAERAAEAAKPAPQPTGPAPRPAGAGPLGRGYVDLRNTDVPPNGGAPKPEYTRPEPAWLDPSARSDYSRPEARYEARTEQESGEQAEEAESDSEQARARTSVPNAED
jgi:hypothetical protein